MATKKKTPPKPQKPTRTRSAIGKHSRRKGKKFEQIVALEFRGIFGDQVKRGWQARQGSDAPDVEGVPGWWVEAKNHHKVNVRAAFEQVIAAQEDALRKKDPRAELKPLVVTKDDGKEALATLRFEDFVELVRTTAGVPPVAHADAAELGRILAFLGQAGIEAQGDLGSLTEVTPSEGVRQLVEEVQRLRSSTPSSLSLAQPPRDHRDRPAGHDDGTV